MCTAQDLIRYVYFMCEDFNFETSIKHLLYIMYCAEHKYFQDKKKLFFVKLENRHANK